MGKNGSKSILGVVGGMGPMASAEFLKTIYECTLGPREQESPVVILYSDPTFPDRTDAFLARSADVVLEQLIKVLRNLRSLGASPIIICCMTIHHLLPRLPDDLRGHVVSLLDVIFARVGDSGKKHLLICSSGSREFKLFENHSQWESLKHHFVMPDEADQSRIHKDMIYLIKGNPDLRELFPLLESLLKKYKVDSFITGCSEIHMLAKQFMFTNQNRKKFTCVDPFTIIAESLKGERI